MLRAILMLPPALLKPDESSHCHASPCQREREVHRERERRSMPLKLMVGVPSHSGTIVMECASTLLQIQDFVKDRGGTFQFIYQGGAVISDVRNAITSDFLNSDAEALLMIDADQGIERETVERMIDLNRPVVGCLYPFRRYEWANVMTTNDIQLQALQYVGSLIAGEDGDISVVDGFARATFVGAGALLIRRTAFETLMAHFPELSGVGYSPDYYPGSHPNWGFFNPIVQENGRFTSEDISFCRRWIQVGGEIWADVTGTISHVGLHSFSGSFLQTWNSRNAHPTSTDTPAEPT